MPTIKTGVTLDEEVLEKLNRFMDVMGYTNRSRVINEALNIYIVERSALLEKGSAVGILAIIYDHHASNIEHEMTHIQHDYLDIIISTLHVHLDKVNCLQVIVVRGKISKIKSLIVHLEHQRGIKILRHILSRIEDTA